MYFIFTLITGAFLPVVLSCSVPPGGVFYYGPTQRTILAPIVFQGRVINTTTSNFPTATGQTFDACVEIRKIFKSPFEIPTVVCFGQFGVEELCLTYVFEGNEYVFFLNEDFTARYDGFSIAAYRATQQIVAAVQAGYCRASIDPNCGKSKKKLRYLEIRTYLFIFIFLSPQFTQNRHCCIIFSSRIEKIFLLRKHFYLIYLRTFGFSRRLCFDSFWRAPRNILVSFGTGSRFRPSRCHAIHDY